MRRLTFWGAVAGVSIISPLLLQVISDRTGSPGLAKFNSYLKNGG